MSAFSKTLKKAQCQKISMVTCYDSSFARIVDASNIDLILVGDSLGHTTQGRSSTLAVSLEEMIYHTQNVLRIKPKQGVIIDLPFLSYQPSPTHALLNAGRALKETGADCVKLEGGEKMATTIEHIVEAGIPVMGHIGLEPQQIKIMGGYKRQGKTKESAKALIKAAKTLESAGACALVLEGIACETAHEITENISVPTIGIGSGPNCNGQVLVLQDLLGMDPEFQPSFVKQYMNGYESIKQALNQFSNEVKDNTFPSPKESFTRTSSSNPKA